MEKVGGSFSNVVGGDGGRPSGGRTVGRSAAAAKRIARKITKFRANQHPTHCARERPTGSVRRGERARGADLHMEDVYSQVAMDEEIVAEDITRDDDRVHESITHPANTNAHPQTHETVTQTHETFTQTPETVTQAPPVGQPQEPNISNIGAPAIPNLLVGYANHRAIDVWLEAATKKLKVVRHVDLFESLKTWNRDSGNPNSWFVLAQRSGLTSLEDISFGGVDHSLVHALVDRWHPETSGFSLPWGHMSITLHDVALILGFPIDGDPLDTPGSIEGRQSWLRDTFSLSAEDMEKITTTFVPLSLIEQATQKMMDAGGAPAASLASGYLMILLETSLFLNKSTNLFPLNLVDLVRDHATTGAYAWGAGVLAWLYRQLGIASRRKVTTIGGCTSLLQYWIYAHFPTFRPSACMDSKKLYDPRYACRFVVPKTPEWSLRRVEKFRRQIDMMRAEDVDFMPYGLLDFETRYRVSRYRGVLNVGSIQESYNPDWLLRQFGFIQTIPDPPRIEPMTETRSVGGRDYKVDFFAKDKNWDKRQLESSIVSFAELIPVNDPWDVSDDYLSWYTDRCHPYVLRTSIYMAPPLELPPPPTVRDLRFANIHWGRMREMLHRPDPTIFSKDDIRPMLQILEGAMSSITITQVRASQPHESE